MGPAECEEVVMTKQDFMQHLLNRQDALHRALFVYYHYLIRHEIGRPALGNGNHRYQLHGLIGSATAPGAVNRIDNARELKF